ncbi:MAG: hypothetical protein Kapaf2KO_17640 [Candidatus Kapaibacteriales bacterium]
MRYCLPLVVLLLSQVLYSQARADRDSTRADEEGKYAKEFGAEAIVITASQSVQAVQEVPISVSSIQGEMIRLRNTNTLDEALQYVPGVEINQDNISIRGSSGFSFGIGSRAVVLLDGFPLLAADNGDVKFDALPVYNLKRIEVVKGAGSALYGTSAIGGVINIITEEAEEGWNARVRSYSGGYLPHSYDEWRYTEEISFENGLDLAASYGGDGYSITYTGGLVEDNSYRQYDRSFRYNSYLNGTFDLGEFTELKVLLGYAEENRDDWIYWRNISRATIPALRQDWLTSGLPDAEPFTQVNSKKTTATATLKHIFKNGSFLVGRSGIFYSNFDNGLAELDVPESNREEWNRNIRESDAIASFTEIQYNLFLTEDIFLTSGVSSQFNSVQSINFGDNLQSIFALYTQAEYKPVDDFTLTLGARIDAERTDTISSPAQFSPKLGLSYRATDDLSLRASVGRGFRAPIIAERYAAASFQGFNVVPNIDLKPETSWSYEVGGIYDLDLGFPLTFEVAGFLNDMSDLIEPTFNEEALIQFQNIVDARIMGVEVAARTFIGGILGFESSLTFINPVNQENNQILNYRSEYLWYTRMLLPWGPLTLSADFRYKSPFVNTDVLLASQVDDAEIYNGMRVLDFRAQYNFEDLIGSPLSLTLNLNNALNYYYTEMVGNLGPTRQIQLTLEAGI